MNVYRGNCEKCDFTTAETAGGTPALILDAASNDPCADPNNPRLILLDDDNARETIVRNGHTFISATLKGRYLRVTEYFCVKCGHLYQQRTLAPAFAQFAWRLWCVLAIPFALLFFAISPNALAGILNGVFFGFIAAGATLALTDPICRLFLRLLYPQRARAFQTQRGCPTCGSTATALPGIYQGQLPCPRCKISTMSIVASDTKDVA